MSFELPIQRLLKLLRDEDPGKPAWYDDWLKQSEDARKIEIDTPPGVIPVRQELRVLPADNPEQLRLGWRVREVIGIGIVNPNISRLSIQRDDD